MLQWEQIMRGKEHWLPKCVVRPPFYLFTCLSTTQQRLVASPRGPGVVRFNVNAGHFLTTATRVTSPTWGPPPPCKQALTLLKKWSKVFFSFSMYYLLIVSWLPLCVKLAQLLCKCQQMTKMNNHVPKERLATSRLNYVLSKATHMTLP